jgi:V/A-type H+-transporting ATPase subunit I
MIITMSKVEIVGPKALLQDVLSLVRQLGIVQIERDSVGFIDKGVEEHIRSFLLDEKALSERLFLENLRQKLDELLAQLPKVPLRESYIEPLSIIDTIAYTINKHGENVKLLRQKREALQKELSELNRHTVFLKTLGSLFTGVEEAPDLDFVGLTIKDPAAIGRLREVLSRLTDWKFELLTAVAEDGTTVGLITIGKKDSEKVRKALSDEQIPELGFPPSFGPLSFPEKLAYLKRRVEDLSSGIRAVDEERANLCRRWAPIYGSVKRWVDERLSLLRTAASVFETRMCFFIYGWMPTEDVGRLRGQLAASFGMQVVLEEGEIREQDLEQVPVVLKNPPYFKPFELFVRLLPLPRYTSFDPTPFIGIFFPIFFGMILGDVGYGVLLVVIAVIFRKRFSKKRDMADASKILLIASLNTIVFGFLYGEFFGDLGHKLFGLEPICIERRTSILPMLAFALAVGVAHVTLGLVLGMLSAFKRKMRKEAIFKLITLSVILCMVAIFASFFEPFPYIITRPAIIVILALTPLLLFTGGLLAPLELLKSIGNIISYARIMAIGLTSVLLAFVANQLAGLTGDIIVGIIVGGLLHALNILLGVLAPTIHSLRLHYVEFFSKFLQYGGRKFEPLKR